MAPKKQKKMGAKPALDHIVLRSAPGDPPATIAGGNKWIKRWILLTKASGAGLTVGDISAALGVTSTKDSMRLRKIQAYSPMDSIGQSVVLTVKQTALIGTSAQLASGAPDLSITDYGTGTSRAAVEALLPTYCITFGIDATSTEILCTGSASGTSPGAIVYRIMLVHTV